MKRRVALGLAFLGVFGLAACLGWPFWFLFGEDIREYFSRVPFDSAAWKGADLGDYKNPVRLRMVDDLLKRH